MLRGMAVIHATTLVPGKLELLAAWLPTQPWYRPGPAGPTLHRAGGFRLDDPAGEVGVEVLLAVDTATGTSVGYTLPMTYRAEPLPDPEALIGTAEHGVLGRRYVLDAARDPVALAQLAALVRGEVQAQHQSESHTPDPSVEVVPGGSGPLEFVRVLDPDARAGAGSVTTPWRFPDGRTVRCVVARG